MSTHRPPETAPDSGSGFAIGLGLRDTGWHPGSWFRIPGSQEIFTSTYWGELAADAEEGGLDYVTFDDSLGLQRHGQLDASLIAAWVGARTSRIGLIPTLTTTHTEPFHLSKNLATLDYISRGRAGWLVEVSATEAEARLAGRNHPPAELLPESSEPWLAELFAESEEAVDVVRRLWDSWEEDAEIRDAETGRFIDREKLHYIDYEGARFSIKGPSITPRPPQGQPVVSYQGQSDPVIKAAVTSADVLFAEPPSRSEARDVIRTVRETERRFARRDRPLKVYADITVLVDQSTGAAQDRWGALTAVAGENWTPAGELVVAGAEEVAEVVSLYRDIGFDGVRLKPVEHAQDLTTISELLVPELAARGVFSPGREALQLRHLLGLGDASNRFAHGGRAQTLSHSGQDAAPALAGGRL